MSAFSFIPPPGWHRTSETKPNPRPEVRILYRAIGSTGGYDTYPTPQQVPSGQVADKLPTAQVAVVSSALLDAARVALRHLEDRNYNYGNDWHDHEAADVATALERAIEDVERAL